MVGLQGHSSARVPKCRIAHSQLRLSYMLSTSASVRMGVVCVSARTEVRESPRRAGEVSPL